MGFTISSEKRSPLRPSLKLWLYVTKQCLLRRPITEFEGARIEWRKIQ